MNEPDDLGETGPITAQNYRYAWRHGWRWALSSLAQGKPIVAARTVYLTLVCGHIGETCERCGRPYILWWAPDDLWQEVVGQGGLYCPTCFDRRATKLGMYLKWQPEKQVR